MKEQIDICLTGHRPDKLAGYDLSAPYYTNLQKLLFTIIEKALLKYTIVSCHSGLALGADTIWSKAILQAKEEYGDRVKFTAHIPNWNHSNRWITQEDKDFWQYQIDKADNIVVVDETGEKSFGWALNARNGTMVNASDVVIAVYNGDETGGTANCVKLARNKNRAMIVIDPKTLKIKKTKKRTDK